MSSGDKVTNLTVAGDCVWVLSVGWGSGGGISIAFGVVVSILFNPANFAVRPKRGIIAVMT